MAGLKSYTISSKSTSGSDVPEPVPCPYCGKLRYWTAGVIGNRRFWFTTPDDCGCEGEKAAKAALEEKEKQKELEKSRRRLLAGSGMGRKMQGMTFHGLTIKDENKAVVSLCERYANAECKTTYPNGIMLTGSFGVGKTHLAAAIANRRMERGEPVVCQTQSEILQSIRSTYGGNGDEEASIRRYQTVPLLIIDDMGKEQATEWAAGTLFRIIDGRYSDFRPIVITTNYDVKGLIKRLTPPGGDSITAQAIVDRLDEMCYTAPMHGKSWRSRS